MYAIKMISRESDVKAVLFERQLSQGDMAKIIGIDQATLSRIINGKQQCSKLVAYAITKFLNSDSEISNYFDRVECEVK